MARPKHKHPEACLTRPVAFRLTAREHQQLETIRRQSDCHSIGEVIRRQLAGKPLKVFYRDTTRDPFLEELAGIRRELKLMGLHVRLLCENDNAAGKALEQYRQVEGKVNLLLSLIAQLAKTW